MHHIFIRSILIAVGVIATASNGVANTPVCDSRSSDFSQLACTATNAIDYDRVLTLKSDPMNRGYREELLEILDSKLDISAWENAILVLGILGEGGDADRLISFATSAYGNGIDSVPPAVYRAKQQTFRALGLLLNRTNDEKEKGEIRSFFQRALEDPAWIKSVKWSSPFHDHPQELFFHLVTVAMEGAGLSGDASLREKLYQLRDSHLCTLKRKPNQQIFTASYRRNTHNIRAENDELFVATRNEFEHLTQMAADAAGASEFIGKKSVSEYYRYILDNPPPVGRIPQPCDIVLQKQP